MARGGGNRVPSRLKALRGTWRNDRASGGEPEFLPLERRCPSWLPDDAKRLWRYLAPRLAASGVLTEADLPAFELLAVSYAIVREAAAVLKRDGVMVEDPAHKAAGGAVPMRKNPALQIIRDATASFVTLASRFGLSPADRAKLTVATPEEPNEFELFMRGRKGGDSL